MVEIWIDGADNVTGINIFRSTSINGTYVSAGKTTSYSSNYGQYYFTDTSSMITPGQSIFYKISYFNENGNGQETDPIQVRILQKYNLYQTTPANYSTITDTTPMFKWSSQTISGADRYDSVFIREVTGELVWQSNVLINQEQGECEYLLSYNKLYEWVIYSQYQ